MSIESGGSDTEDATATADDILYPKTAYTAKGKVQGTIQATYEDTGLVEKTTDVGITSYYIFDYLPKLKVGLVGTSTSPTSVYVAQYDEETNAWLTTNRISIAKADNTNNIISAKFAGLPVVKNEADGLYEYRILINGQNAGNYDYHYFKGARVRIQFDLETGLATFTLLKNFTTYQDHAWYTTGNSIYNIVANPNSDNMFYYRILASIRMNNHGVIRALVYDSSISFAEQNTYYYNSDGEAWLQFSQDGAYVSFYQGTTNHIGTIKTSNNSAAKGVIGMHSITNVGTAYYYFYNYNVYTLSGTKLTSYTSLDYNSFSYSWCFWLGNKVLMCNNRYILVAAFDENWNMTLVCRYDLGDKAYVPNSYSYKYTKLGHFTYKDGSIICETNRGTILIISEIAGDAIKSVEIKGLLYSSGIECTATNSQVLNGKTFISKGGLRTGTMPNRGELNYTPSTSEQTIPYGYTSGGTVAAVTSAIDSNIIPENIKTGVTILGVEGTLEKIEGGSATSDVALQAKYLLEGYTAVVDDNLIVGTMKEYGTYYITPGEQEVEIPSGHYDSLRIYALPASSCEGYTTCKEAIASI